MLPVTHTRSHRNVTNSIADMETMLQMQQARRSPARR